MFKNHLKIALRHILKYKGFSFINIAGLAIGLTCFLLISLFIAHELSYDRWNPQAERIVRPYSDIKFGGSELHMAVSAAVLGPDVAKEMPEVQTFCRLRQYGTYLVKRDGDMQQNFEERELLTVDSSFFEVFPLPILAGNPKTCLEEPNTIAISKTKAEKYFGTIQMAMGETLVLDNRQKCKVTAVYEDLPSNNHFDAHFLISMNGNREVEQASPLWATSNNFHTYFLLRPGTDVEAFKTKFDAFSEQKIAETAKMMMNLSLEEFEATGQYARYTLQDLTDIHLYSDLDIELSANSNIQYIWVFGAIALFVLFIACINFMNLTTARSAQRAKEIGVRKVLGGLRSNLVSQFLSETVFLTIVAVVLAVGLAALVLPWFNELSTRDLSMPWGSGGFWLALALGTGLVGLVAGSYPAFFLSAFNTIKILKGQTVGKNRGGGLRSALVVFQFTTSIVLIVGTMLVYKQLNYIQDKKLGFQKDQVIIVDNAYALGDKVEVYREEIKKQPGIKSVTVSSYLPVPSSRSNNTFVTSREFRQDNAINMGQWRVDFDYLETLGLEMADGRYFDRSFSTDSSGIILNETAAAILGWDNPIGQRLYQPSDNVTGQPNPEDFDEYTIIGVVKDFHWESLRENIGPLSLMIGRSTAHVSCKFSAAESASVVQSLEAQWKKLSPEQPFSYRFMDNSFSSMYEAEQQIGSIALTFALLAIFISCLGLFGLASFTAEQRTKEIGIRKVLGANTPQIVQLLSKDFLRLVLIALVIATPIAWYSMQQWLQDFAYRIEINWGVFVLAGFAAVGIAIFSVSFQSVRAALANPVDSLRGE